MTCDECQSSEGEQTNEVQSFVRNFPFRGPVTQIVYHDVQCSVSRVKLRPQLIFLQDRRLSIRDSKSFEKLCNST